MGINYPCKFFYGMLIDDILPEDIELEEWLDKTQTPQEALLFGVEMESSMGDRRERPVNIYSKAFYFKIDGRMECFKEYEFQFLDTDERKEFETAVCNWASRNNIQLKYSFQLCLTFEMC